MWRFSTTRGLQFIPKQISLIGQYGSKGLKRFYKCKSCYAVIDKQIVLVNAWKPRTSLYIYSRLILSISKNFEVIDLTNDVTNKGFVWNLKNFLLTFTTINTIYKIKNKKRVVHYIDPTIAPLTTMDTNIVTIWDDPSIVLNTDLYMDSYLIKTHFKGNIKRFSKFKNVITPTNYIKRSLEAYGFDGKITSIYTPVRPIFRNLPNKKELRRELGLPLEKTLILSISVDVKRKNLEMVKKISDRLENSFRIVRIGKPLSGSITFHNIDDETIVKIYNACDLLLMPSLEEGQGFPVSEAFKAGLPVVASDIPVFREVAGDAAVFVDPRDENSVISGIHDAMSRSKDLIEKGFMRSKLFDYSIFKEKMLDYYNSVIGDDSS